jgi:serine protease
MSRYPGKTRHALALAGFAATLLVGGSAFAQNAVPVDAAVADPFAANPLDTDSSKDQVVLDVADDVSDAEVKRLAAECGLDVRLNSVWSDPANVYIADVAEGAVPGYLECLDAKVPEGWLEAGEENFELALLGAPNDPLYQFQWNFKQVNAEEAWKVSTGKDVVVSVIDTGVAVEDDPNRDIKAAKDLAGTKTVDGYDFVDDDSFAWDGHGHGTHVAGTIAQTTNNKYGVAGLAYNSTIMPLRVLNSRGFGQVADIADAIRFSADNGAHVINMSLGGPLPSLVMKRAIDHAYKKGVTIIAAAGNGGKRAPSYPAAYDHVVAVAATQFDKSTTFYSQWGKYVDIAAPGGNTRVDQNGDGRPDGVMQQTLKNGNTNEHDFVLYMGTSMASPHVAAGAAMVIAQGVTHPDKVEAVLQKTADDSQSDRYDEKEYEERYGAGIMQTDKAVKAAAGEQGGWRLGVTFLLGLLAFGRLRRKDMLSIGPKATPLFVGSAVLASSGLFFLPLLFGDGGCLTGLMAALSHPIAEMDMALLGPSFHQNPLLASALIPLGAVLTLSGSKRWKYLGAGLAIGFAGFLFTESVLMTSDVRWIPGMDVLDRIWLLGNGAISMVLGYLALKRK